MTKQEMYMVGNTVYVYLFKEKDEEKIRADIEKLVKPNGDALVSLKDGTRTWIEDQPVFDSSKEGSDRYTWDRTGNRVLCERIRFQQDGDEMLTRVLKRVWREFDSVA